MRVQRTLMLCVSEWAIVQQVGKKYRSQGRKSFFKLKNKSSTVLYAWSWLPLLFCTKMDTKKATVVCSELMSSWVPWDTKHNNLHKSKRPLSLPLMYFQMFGIAVEVILLLLRNFKTCCHFPRAHFSATPSASTRDTVSFRVGLPRRLLYNWQTQTSENRPDIPQIELLYNFHCELHFLFLIEQYTP